MTPTQPAALMLKSAPPKTQSTMTHQQASALSMVQSPDLMGSLTDSQKIQLLLDINTYQQTKIDHLDTSFNEFRHWVQNRLIIAGLGGVVGGAGIGYGGSKALALIATFAGLV